MIYDIDIVSVAHRAHTHDMMMEMFESVYVLHRGRVRTIGVDNRINNRGFARGCSYGASQTDAPIIGFLNPDTVVLDPFVDTVKEILSQDNVVITGCRFGKTQRELQMWGVRDWVSSAAMFVRRDFWEEQNGFDERFVWGWEETDLIRRAQIAGKVVQSAELPLYHASPTTDDRRDAAYKNYHFDRGAQIYYEKWAGQ